MPVCMDYGLVFSLRKWIFSLMSYVTFFGLLGAFSLYPHRGSAFGPRWGTESVPRHPANAKAKSWIRPWFS